MRLYLRGCMKPGIFVMASDHVRRRDRITTASRDDAFIQEFYFMMYLTRGHLLFRRTSVESFLIRHWRYSRSETLAKLGRARN